jgi:hypothetical protein
VIEAIIRRILQEEEEEEEGTIEKKFRREPCLFLIERIAGM